MREILVRTVVITAMWFFALAGLGLLIQPWKTLYLLSRCGMAGPYYDPERGSDLPLWQWRIGGLDMFLLGGFYGTLALGSSLLGARPATTAGSQETGSDGELVLGVIVFLWTLVMLMVAIVSLAIPGQFARWTGVTAFASDKDYRHRINLVRLNGFAIAWFAVLPFLALL